MKKHLILLQLFFLFSLVAKSQNLDFTAPDTVCVGQSFQIQNTTNANSHLWTICSQNNILLPEGTVIANPNNALERLPLPISSRWKELIMWVLLQMIKK